MRAEVTGSAMSGEAGGFEAFGECALQAEAPVEGSGVERWDA